VVPTVARKNGLTPFSVYQGRWNAAYRDVEAEIVPMCEDQGMAIVSWAALGGGQLMSAEQRQQKEKEAGERKARYPNPNDIKVSEAMEKIATSKKTTLQAIVSSESWTGHFPIAN
jgi:aryl-alcohol dehydrogenase-like predicted oxidoreductase